MYINAFFLVQSLFAVHLIAPLHRHSKSSTALLKSIQPKFRHSSLSTTNFSLPIEEWLEPGCDELLEASSDENKEKIGILCSVNVNVGVKPTNIVMRNLFRGAFLRVTSDLAGGTPLENIKTRVAATTDSPLQAFRGIVAGNNGFLSLWSGSSTRAVEGALLGGVFMVASVATKKQVLYIGGSKAVAALVGGIVGGVAQTVVMTPASLVLTSLNLNQDKPGYENDNSYTVARRIINEKGIKGMFIGAGPMAARQASNWSSRSMLTEIARSNLRLSRFGLVGEIGSGLIGGVGSCWNTPIERVRVLMQRDVVEGRRPKTFYSYYDHIVDEAGFPGLFRGVTPRALQAMWQTVFMVVVPNILGV